jgi:phosphoadenosine phosphosulfate reductase
MNENSVIDDQCRQIEDEINQFKREGKKLFLSSSLQTHSVPLLDIIYSIDPTIPVFFIDTGYHFPETILFKNRLKKEYGYPIIELSSPVNRYQQKDSNGQLLYTSDPDYCCYLNKILPLEPILKEYDVWISGVRASQSAFRSELGKVSKGNV